MRIVEVIADTAHTDTLAGMAEQYGATDIWWGVENEDGRRSFRMLVADDARQALVDALQSLLGAADTARIIILPVDAALPRPKQDGDEEGKKRKTVAATREELYSEIAKGARLDSNFLLLTLLSTIVAAIGLAEDNVAVVVGAMVIAPLLGPNIALAFGTSLGDRELMWQALKTNLAGLGLALALSLIIGLIWPVNLASQEIMARTDVGMDSVALALASGAAAVLSLTTGLSTTLVGVMVAVALLPPTATLGMLLGGGQPGLAIGAALLLAVNLVCVLLAAKAVFLFKGVKPRTWLERTRAKQSTAISLALWAALLLMLIAVILVRSSIAE
ncbi:MAG: TIGR00341 family protein [Pseudomonadota bacterium]|nr:TIGR00341 family protein [Pseudomonadota bacterium]